MITITYSVIDEMMIVSLTGMWEPGSLGSWVGKEVVEKINSIEGCNKFQLDLSRAHYSGGDTPSVIVIQAAYKGMKPEIIVGPYSKEAIESLVIACGLGALGITVTEKLV